MKPLGPGYFKMVKRGLALGGAVATFAGASAPAAAGSFNVRDGAGYWSFGVDPKVEAHGFLLKHFVADNRLDADFGQEGQTAIHLPVDSVDANSMRVDATRRIWIASAGLAGAQPQAIVARFLRDGSPDLLWGVQGRVQLSPAGFSISPCDLLPLADGSVLVAGQSAGGATPRAVVFHLRSDGTLDRQFGNGGVWQRQGDDGASVATSLAANADGLVAVAVAVHGPSPHAELWSLTKVAPVLLQQAPLEGTGDGDDLRVDAVATGWVFSHGGGATDIVQAASLEAGAATPSLAQPATSMVGAGAVNPYAAEAASGPGLSSRNDSLPWAWISAALAVIAGAVGVFATRNRQVPPRTPRQPRDR